MNEVENYEIHFTKRSEREDVKTLARSFFDSDFQSEFMSLTQEERTSVLDNLSNSVFESAKQSKNEISLVAKDTSNQNIIAFLSAETFDKNSIIINFVLTNSSYNVSAKYTTMFIEALKILLKYFGLKNIYVKLNSENQKGTNFLRRTFETSYISSPRYDIMKLNWSKYFMKNNVTFKNEF